MLDDAEEQPRKVHIQVVRGSWDLGQHVFSVKRALTPQSMVVDRAFLLEQRKAVESRPPASPHRANAASSSERKTPYRTRLGSSAAERVYTSSAACAIADRRLFRLFSAPPTY